MLCIKESCIFSNHLTEIHNLYSISWVWLTNIYNHTSQDLNNQTSLLFEKQQHKNKNTCVNIIILIDVTKSMLLIWNNHILNLMVFLLMYCWCQSICCCFKVKDVSQGMQKECMCILCSLVLRTLSFSPVGIEYIRTWGKFTFAG